MLTRPWRWCICIVMAFDWSLTGTLTDLFQEPVCLQPLHVLQCHSKQDDPNDFKTQLWACAFEPATDKSGQCG